MRCYLFIYIPYSQSEQLTDHLVIHIEISPIDQMLLLALIHFIALVKTPPSSLNSALGFPPHAPFTILLVLMFVVFSAQYSFPRLLVFVTHDKSNVGEAASLAEFELYLSKQHRVCNYLRTGRRERKNAVYASFVSLYMC